MLDGSTATRKEASLWNRTGDCPRARAAKLIAPDDLSGTAHDHDTAVKALYEQVLRTPTHQDFLQRLRAAGEAERPSAQNGDVLVGVIPGAFYLERPETGAGGEAMLGMLQALGVAAERVPLPSLATCKHNSELLHLWAERHTERPLVLVSLSKGSLDVLQALNVPDHALRKCRLLSWISLSGILQGTPLVDWLHQRRLRRLVARGLAWCRRLDWEALLELKYRPTFSAISANGRLASLRIAHVVGFPRLCDLSSPLARRIVRRTAGFGPNDGGGIVLADVLSWPGVIYPVWGADHYLQPHTKLFALIRSLLAWAAETDA